MHNICGWLKTQLLCNIVHRQLDILTIVTVNNNVLTLCQQV